MMRSHFKRLLNQAALVLFFIIFVFNSLNAQDLRVISGKDYYKNGNYSMALAEFNGALQNPARLGRDVLPEAYFFRALTRIRIYNNEVINGKADTTDDNNNSLLNAYKDFKSALLNDDGKWGKKVNTELKNLYPYLLRNGLEALNQSNDLKQEGKIFDVEAKLAEENLSAARDIEDTYLVNDLLGQAGMNLKNIPAALSDFARSEDLYRNKPPEIPDFLIGYVPFRMAEIHFLYQDDADRALEDIRRGKELIQNEYSRLKEMQAKQNTDEMKDAENKYLSVYRDLSDLQLQILLKSPAKYDQALAAFENQVKNNSKDPDVYVGYASLLEKTDQEKALTYYKKALELDSNDITALFNAGALYYNKGREYFQQASDEKDDAKYKIILEEALQNFRDAKPYFEKFLKISPESEEAIEALKAIAMVLDDQTSYEMYKQKSENIKDQKNK